MLGSVNISKAHIRIKPIDFRKGMDGLIGLISQELKQDPRSGAAFVFRNNRGTGIKVLYYDGWAYWLCQKRLSEGVLKNWPKSATEVLSLNVQEFLILLMDGDLRAANFKPVFQEVMQQAV